MLNPNVKLPFTEKTQTHMYIKVTCNSELNNPKTGCNTHTSTVDSR